ncbi:hypothetical protein Sm713_64590 [Streptomyces sp. TS71-3]|nr:hypothetical protein Sm713_64590 [Streptomyces sp. TS71-3]
MEADRAVRTTGEPAEASDPVQVNGLVGADEPDDAVRVNGPGRTDGLVRVSAPARGDRISG